MDSRLKELGKRLKKTISQVLDESVELGELIDEVNETGYVPIIQFDLRLLSLSVEKGSAARTSAKKRESVLDANGEVKYNGSDRRLLRAMKISLNDKA